MGVEIVKKKGRIPYKIEYENPAISAYKENHYYSEKGWKPVHILDSSIQKYTEYIPTDKAIDTIKKYSPIVEIGGGNGYWAHLLNKQGVDILCTDKTPTERHKWYPVKEKDHRAVSEHPERNVLLCHPPGFKWCEEMLSYMSNNQKLIFVGEWFPGADASPGFFKELRDQWRLIETFPVLDWATMHVKGYVFEKYDGNEADFSVGMDKVSYGYRNAFETLYKDEEPLTRKEEFEDALF